MHTTDADPTPTARLTTIRVVPSSSPSQVPSGARPAVGLVAHRRRSVRIGRIVLVAAAAVLLVALVASLLLGVDGVRGASNGSGGPALSLPAPAETAEGGFGVDDGYIAEGDGVSPFADELPAIARLDPELRDAMQAAARDAIADGVDFIVTNGWRSAAYQQALLDDAVREYGSEAAAAAYVASPETSKHVTGEAVDIGRTDADSWLSQHGADYGMCQIYANEMWHFELATTPGGECPIMLSDASEG